MEDYYIEIKEELRNKPKQLTNLEEWLYVVINTAKSIIDNTSKEDISCVIEFCNCNNTNQIQQKFDIIQGKFAREGFTQRYSPNYLYLCSLVANFSNQELSQQEKDLMKEYCKDNNYLLYAL